MTYGEILKNIRELMYEWGECEPELLSEIEAKIIAERNKIGSLPKKIMKLEREIKRFNTFRYDQEQADNVLSLLKICNRIEIEYDNDIDIFDIDIDTMIHNMYNICEEEWMQENGGQEEISIDELFKIKGLVSF